MSRTSFQRWRHWGTRLNTYSQSHSQVMVETRLLGFCFTSHWLLILLALSVFSWSWLSSFREIENVYSNFFLEILYETHSVLTLRDSVSSPGILIQVGSTLTKIVEGGRCYPHIDACHKGSFLCWQKMRSILVSPNTLRRRQWHPTPVLLPGESHGQKSLVGCSPWGC